MEWPMGIQECHWRSPLDSPLFHTKCLAYAVASGPSSVGHGTSRKKGSFGFKVAASGMFRMVGCIFAGNISCQVVSFGWKCKISESLSSLFVGSLVTGEDRRINIDDAEGVEAQEFRNSKNLGTNAEHNWLSRIMDNPFISEQISWWNHCREL